MLEVKIEDEAIGIEMVIKWKLTLAVCNDTACGWGYNSERWGLREFALPFGLYILLWGKSLLSLI